MVKRNGDYLDVSCRWSSKKKHAGYCLILCAELCKPGFKTHFGQTPYHYDSVDFEQLHDRISSSGVDCSRHFVKIEKLMTGPKYDVNHFIEMIICPMLVKIFNMIGRRQASAGSDEEDSAMK